MSKEAWRLIFAGGLFQNFLDGETVVDFRVFREGSNNFKKGQLIEGHFHEGFKVLLEVMESTQVTPFGKIAPSLCDEWGKPTRKKTSHAQMMDTMREYYSEVTDRTMAAVNHLRFPRLGSRPIVGRLPEDLMNQLSQDWIENLNHPSRRYGG